MDKQKSNKTIIITTTILVIVFILAIIISIIFIKKNNDLKNDPVDIVISQKQGNDIIEVYRELFTNELEYMHTFESFISPGKSNKVIIKNGECWIVNSTCPTHTCEDYRITNKKGIFNPSSTITCLPNGLYISLEAAKE